MVFYEFMTNFTFHTQNSLEIIEMTSVPNQDPILIEVNKIWIDKQLGGIESAVVCLWRYDGNLGIEVVGVRAV